MRSSPLVIEAAGPYDDIEHIPYPGPNGVDTTTCVTLGAVGVVGMGLVAMFVPYADWGPGWGAG